MLLKCDTWGELVSYSMCPYSMCQMNINSMDWVFNALFKICLPMHIFWKVISLSASFEVYIKDPYSS